MDKLLEAGIAAVLVEPELVVEGRGVGSVIKIGVCSRRSLSDDFFCSKDEWADEGEPDVLSVPTPDSALVVGDNCECDCDPVGDAEKLCCSGPGLGRNSPRSPSIEILSIRSSPSLPSSSSSYPA